MTALACDDVCARLKRADVPVLLLDTCIILDIVRAPTRDPIGVHDIKAVHTLLARATKPNAEVSIVINEQVRQEFQTHVGTVEVETGRELKRSTEQLAGIVTRMTALSPAAWIPEPVDLVSLGFPAMGRRIAEQVLQASIVLADHSDEIVKAHKRLTFANPPATQAKQSAKDCLITESYLRIARALHSAGFSRNMVFATSNTKDYQQGHQSLHPVLRTEFSTVGLEYSPSWSAARHELDRPQTPLTSRHSL